ncbi:hypothetical protein [Dactylosporangium matsuzakiense]|uniref:hypothetical protein n=1 Tax=Dactylosporangium matsuzakiense TaxID=53360 RepID=UPI0027960C32|nr:hypothetical protein [Dactylosporangium matsuzakiense]
MAGANGAGKTTLLAILAGLRRPLRRHRRGARRCGRPLRAPRDLSRAVHRQRRASSSGAVAWVNVRPSPAVGRSRPAGRCRAADRPGPPRPVVPRMPPPSVAAPR